MISIKNKKAKIFFVFLTFIQIAYVNNILAFNYGEHQDIGNKAMILFFKQNNDFKNSVFGNFVPLKYDNHSQNYIFGSLSKNEFPISYGTINALSGDHSENPLLLEQQLLTQNGIILKTILLHNHYIKLGYSGALDSKLTKLDPNYTFLAVKNLCHFYEYGKGLHENISDFDIQNIEKIINPSLIGASFKKLNGTNAINMYITLHTASIYLAEIAGVKAKKNDEIEAKKYLFYSFLYNGFADHFLEDAFSGGHLLVKRSVIGSIINNKSLHDFYSKFGTEVVNIRGENWKVYGDGFYNQYHNEYTKKNDLQYVSYPNETSETKIIIEAVNNSISELYESFERGFQQGENITYIIKRAPNVSEKSETKCNFFISNFKALSIIPLPYNSNLKIIMSDSLSNKANIKEINRTPYYRNFVRSRIANSIIFGGNTGFISENATTYTNSFLRLNVGLLKSKYDFNKKNGKKGVLDIWHGYTASYTLGHYLKDEKDVIGQNWILKGGIRSNYDFWISNKRFIGVYMYNEMGMEKKDFTSAFVYVPQIGLQLGSLLKINYYNMPLILRIPAQLFLPLNLHFGCVYSTRSQPLYYLGTEINIFF
jgi:hypothetical protein